MSTESPRWLYTKGRTQEAHKAMAWIARWNRTKMPDDCKVIVKVRWTKLLRRQYFHIFRGFHHNSFVRMSYLDNVKSYTGKKYTLLPRRSTVCRIQYNTVKIVILPMLGYTINTIASARCSSPEHLTTSSAATDENLVKMTTSPFQHLLPTFVNMQHSKCHSCIYTRPKGGAQFKISLRSQISRNLVRPSHLFQLSNRLEIWLGEREKSAPRALCKISKRLGN